jgi:hypothetical protein
MDGAVEMITYETRQGKTKMKEDKVKTRDAQYKIKPRSKPDQDKKTKNHI